VDHERYMRQAMEIAQGNPDAPFGCVIVDRETEEIVAEGVNDAEKRPHPARGDGRYHEPDRIVPAVNVSKAVGSVSLYLRGCPS
jgi:deoxycytidylate deaminase